MKKAYVLVGMVAILIMGYIGVIPARSVSSMRSFYRAIEKERFAVAMLYRAGKSLKKDNPALYDQIAEAKEIFRSLSDIRPYKKADVAFVRANVADNQLANLPEDFGITVGGEPVYLLFKKGAALRGAAGNPEVLHGFVTRPQLHTFVDKNLGGDIQGYLEYKAERREQQRSDSRVYFGVGGGYPWYGYYPYYGGIGYPYGYGYGGRVGFGVSFGI